MFMQNKQSGLIAVVTAAAVLWGGMIHADPLEDAMKLEKRIVRDGARSQKRIDKLAEATRDAASEYKLTLQRIDSLKAYNKQYEAMIRSQEAEMASIQRQMDRIDDTERAVVPLMNDMIDRLEQFIELDMPFLMKERRHRVKRLRTSMQRANLTNSEKYRQILEAYTIEMQYGETIEAYQDDVKLDDGQVVKANFLRFGRTALIYQSLDEKFAKYWDADKRAWVDLDDSYRIPVRNAIRIAKGMANPNLVVLPVPAAQPAAGE
jgi:predicted RNase H-like nuclease (RuvC/YqgF family)